MRKYTVPPASPDWLKPGGGARGTYWVAPEERSITFAVKEAAQIFFDRSPSWLRGQFEPADNPEPGERHPKGRFTEEDVLVPLVIHTVQSPVASYEYRRFTLNDIERMLWSQYRHDVIDHVWWYNSIQQTGKRAEHRLARYNEMVDGSVIRLRNGLEVVKAIALVRGCLRGSS